MRTRNRTILLRLTDDELAHLRTLVAKSGLSQEAYLRSLITGLRPRDKPPPDYLAMMRELHAIGNNLNQIAAKLHTLGVLDAGRYDDEVRRLAAALVRITAAVSDPERL